MTEDAFDGINKFMRGMVILFIIAVVGAVGSIILDYIGANGFLDFLAWVIAAIIAFCVLMFVGKIIGILIDGSIFIIKKIF